MTYHRLLSVHLCALMLAGCSFFSDPNEVSIDDTGAADMGATSDVAYDSGSQDGGQSASGDAGPDGDEGNNDIADASMPLANCGDGALQEDEKCDPQIDDVDSSAYCPRLPEDCEDGIACTRGVISGTPAMCNAVCAQIPIEACEDDDGCCPSDCGPSDDNDCDDSDVCGDGAVTGAELCDPGAVPGAAGACPRVAASDCAPMQCMTAVIKGSSSTCDAVCQYNEITSCGAPDGCCPVACDATSDPDCGNVCGNDIVEPGEKCDGNCPASCDDGNACTVDKLQGSSADCDATCENETIVACVDGDGCCAPGCIAVNDNDCSASCGDGIVDASETCDGNCPVACADGDACTRDNLQGSAAQCTAECVYPAITSCAFDADGCCPPGCNANNDADCSAFCGNGIVESGEKCDGNCPSSCNDGDACTTDGTQGSAASCSLICDNAPILSCVDGDGCCPGGCNSTNDTDCGAVCGNGVTEPGETCDGNCPGSCNDGNACTTDVRSGSASSCNVSCSSSPINSCVDGDSCCPSGCSANNDDDCAATCGNGITEGAETCDGNCPTSSNCSACETFTGSPNNCDAQCVPDVGCVLCDLTGTCPCAAGELCINGRCESASGQTCSEACQPDDYCDVWGGSGFQCAGSTCVECTSDADCSATEACQAGTCDTPPSCDKANEPDQWCIVNSPGADTCVGTTCVKRCTTSGDCTDGETCNVESFCSAVSDCSMALDPQQYCQDAGQGDTCIGGDCYYECGPVGPDGACTCPDPFNQACFAIGGSVPVCQFATLCGQICPIYQDTWCSEITPGTTCQAGNCQ